MGLTSGSTGIKAVDMGISMRKDRGGGRVIALAGNPNVGKSTVFNGLTGLNQHTGNWPGKTVTNAQGACTYQGRQYLLVDIPGSYSLLAHSAEEEVARDFVCFGRPDAVVVVCDATCLERNLNLVLQTMEITQRVVVCVNLMDEARRKGVQVDLEGLSRQLGVPVVATEARTGKGLKEVLAASESVIGERSEQTVFQVRYLSAIEEALQIVEPGLRLIEPRLREVWAPPLPYRWLALRLLEGDRSLLHSMEEALGFDLLREEALSERLREAEAALEARGVTKDSLGDKIVSCIVLAAEGISIDVVKRQPTKQDLRDRRLDRILTSRWTGFPIMLGMLALVFWLTITGANYPSQLLSTGLFWIQDQLTKFFFWAGAPPWLEGMLVQGVYRVLAWVVSVMLPPMAIFFPLFTLLEDLGYLPRVAFNLDRCFKKCHACGKQALTMCMGFGCNAAGIVGCRIIDSPRERLIAIITNNFVPCNGRFPTLIAILTMFFVGTAGGGMESLLSALLLMGLIVLGVIMTFLVSALLSGTILKGVPSSFTLELPPYRRPQIGQVIVRSILDRTLFVLGRAAAVAAPTGLLIWIMANVMVGDATLLTHCAGFLDPFGRFLGLDGVILLAFILGFPANEIVIPIMIMTYLSTGTLTDLSELSALRALFISNGWTWLTAVNVMLFSLMHWPCSTACLTIRKETGSLKWTLISFAVPTVIGMLCCFMVATVARVLELV